MAVSQIVIYETYAAPFVTSVQLIDESSTSTTVFSGTDSTSCGSTLRIPVWPAVVARTVKINTLAVSAYEEIDAVQLCGTVVPFPPTAPPLPPIPPTSPPPCAGQIDVVMVLDNSGSVGSERFNVLAFARSVVGAFKLGSNSAQIGYTEFDATAVTREALTSDLSVLSADIDNAPGPGSGTCISCGLLLGKQVLEGTNARSGVTKVQHCCRDFEPFPAYNPQLTAT
jgi:hypothetical protein